MRHHPVTATRHGKHETPQLLPALPALYSKGSQGILTGSREAETLRLLPMWSWALSSAGERDLRHKTVEWPGHIQGFRIDCANCGGGAKTGCPSASVWS